MTDAQLPVPRRRGMLAPFAGGFEFPTSPTPGQIVTVPGWGTYRWDGVKWIFGPGGGAPAGWGVIISPSEPDDPTLGALWYDGLQMWLWEGSTWVLVSGVGPELPTGEGPFWLSNGEWILALPLDSGTF
jgi:hypothetical protein